MPNPPLAWDDAADRLLLRARYLHEMRVRDVGTLMGISAGSVSTRIARLRDEPLELPRPASGSGDGLPGPPFEAEPEGADGKRPLRARMERLVAHRMSLLEREAALGRPLDAGTNARALALNVRTLAELMRLPPDPPDDRTDDDTPPPRSLSELRDDLWRHFERICAEEDQAAEERAREAVDPEDLRA